MTTHASHFSDFGKAKQKQMNIIKRCNVLVIGNTGVGKSTFISTVLQIPVSQEITKEISRQPYTKDNIAIAFYDTPGLEKENKQRKQVKSEIDQLIKQQKQKEPKEHIHIVWYVLNAQTTRESVIDKNWIAELAQDLPVILVVTRSLSSEKNEFQQNLETTLPIRQLIPVLANSETTSLGLVESHGLEKLKTATESLFDEIVEKAVADAIKSITSEALGWCRDGCGKVLTLHVISNSFSVPYIKSLSSLLQTWMMKDIANAFGCKFDSVLLKDLWDAGLGAVGLINGFDLLIEESFKKLLIDDNNFQNIKDVLEYLATMLRQLSEAVPFRDKFAEMLSNIADSPYLPILSATNLLVTTISTGLIALAWIETLKKYKIAEYQGQPTPDIKAMFAENIELIKQLIQSTFGVNFGLT